MRLDPCRPSGRQVADTRPFDPVDGRLVSIARNTDELGRYSKDSAFQGGDGR